MHQAVWLAAVAVAAISVGITPAVVQKPRSDERASLSRMISYSATGSAAVDLVSRATTFDPKFAAAMSATMNARAGSSELEIERASEALRLTRQETAHVVLPAWADAIGARRQLLALQSLAGDNDKVITLVRSKATGDGRAELIRELDAEQTRVRAAILITEAAFNTSSSRLAALLDASEGSRVEVNTTFELHGLRNVPSDVEELIDRATKGRPDVNIARLDERIASAQFLRSLLHPTIAIGADDQLFRTPPTSTSGPGPAEAAHRRRYLERMVRSQVESAFANFVAGQQARGETESALVTLRRSYATGDLNASQLVLQLRQRLDLEMELEQVTAVLMRAGIDLVTSLGIDP